MSGQRPHLILTICALLAVPAAAQQSGVQWQHDIETAKATARQTGKLVLVHFWTPNCAPCLMLDKTVFNQPGVAGAIDAQFVPVKLNANENSATATGFGITRVPTDVILTPDGKVIGKLISPPTPAAYIAEVSQVAAKHATQPGQAYAKAIESAPAPPLNAAYANLQIAPNTVPALQAQQAATTNDRYAMAPAIGGAPSNAPAAGGFDAAQNVRTGPFGPLTPTVPPTNFSATAPPTISQPAATPAPSPYDQYAPAAPATISNPAPSITVPSTTMSGPPPAAPVQTVNPYAPAYVPSAPPITSPASPAVGPSLIGGTPVATQQPAAPPVASSDGRTLPPNAPPLGFEGYCPVSMRTQWQWVQGDPRWGIVHRGRTYWFAGEAEQQQFWADPDRFSPALSGMDPVLAVDHRQQVPGKREHSIDYDNLFYMFASEATLQQFTANPERYAASVRQAMGIQRGRLVR